MAKTIRLASTQVDFRWSSAAHPANPNCDQFDPGAVPAHIESNTHKQLALFDEAGRAGADLVVGAEDMQRLGRFGMHLDDPSAFHTLVESIPGPTSKRIGAIARKHRVHIVACYPEKAGRRCYNTAVLFGRDGRILGKYRKVQLPANEAWLYSPGDEFPVFKTDLGHVGIAICYDMMFPEAVRCLALQGADLIAHPTMGYGWSEKTGEAKIITRCVDNGVTIVVSHRLRSQVVNPWGEILCDAGTRKNVVVFADWDPRTRTEQAAHHHATVESGIADVRERWTTERRPECFKLICAARPPLLKRYAKRTLLTTKADRYAAYQKARDRARQKAQA